MDLLKILYELKAHNWIEIRKEIKDAVLDYNEAIADETIENPGASLNGCLPIYWQIVRAHSTHRWKKAEPLPSDTQYDVGIFLVGFSSLPIVLSIAEIQPCQKIYFLHSPETKRKCGEITNRIEEMLAVPPSGFDPLITPTDAAALINRVRSADRREITEPADPVETFKQIKEIIDNIREKLGDDTKVALDLTGGKKTMIGGGFTAGSIYALSPRCNMFYVDSSQYDPDLGAPEPGTEFLSQLDNPYNVYNVQSVTEAEKLFDKHNYEAAAGLWEIVDDKLDTYAKRYGLEKEQDTIHKNLHMADCYSLWDTFDYVEAKKSQDKERKIMGLQY